MIGFAPRLQGLAGAALAATSLLLLASCGSGAVSAPPAVATPGTLSVSPASATLFSDLTTNFIITGGSGTYIVTSSNQAVIPISGAFTGNVFPVTPNAVASDTSITLTVSDTAGSTPVTAALVVKPRTVNNTLTVTPSASQSAACGTAVCSGGDAEVAVVLSQAGIPLANRQVRFDVISGDIGIITSPAGLPESTSLTTTTTTDNTGTARVRIRVTPNATAQTALLQVTDVSSGFVQRTAITIAPSSNAPLNAQPNAITFKGTAANTCASGIQADVIVFGGRPPYQISQPGTFTVSPSVVATSGGRFTVTATGQCTAGSAIAIVDANGATTTVNAINSLSDVVAPVPTPAAFSASPSTVSLTSCTDIASVTLAGGSGTYFAASGNNAIVANVSGNTGSIQRRSGSAAPNLDSINVAFSDGKTSVPVTVNLTAAAKSADCK